jgi:hypothetical protein
LIAVIGGRRRREEEKEEVVGIKTVSSIATEMQLMALRQAIVNEGAAVNMARPFHITGCVRGSCLALSLEPPILELGTHSPVRKKHYRGPLNVIVV